MHLETRRKSTLFAMIASRQMSLFLLGLVLVRPDQYVADVWPLDFADRFDAFTRRMFKGA
jgi:hypothetical protein